MSMSMSLALASLPVYLIGLYIYKKDKEKESRKILTKLFLYGILSVIPAIILELLVGKFFPPEEEQNLIEMFMYYFISIAFIEELCKFGVTYLVAYNNKEFDHVYDGLVYSSFATLGFAGIENILYVCLDENPINVGILRAVCSIPGHVGFSIIMGNFLVLAKVHSLKGNKNKEKSSLIIGLLLASLVHGIFDFCLSTGYMIFLILFVFILIFIYTYSIIKVKKLSKITENMFYGNPSISNNISVISQNQTYSQPQIQNQNINNNVPYNQPLINNIPYSQPVYNEYCPNCGTPKVNNFCQKCGYNFNQNNNNSNI